MEIAIISGKGGTGKSSISAAFATLNGDVVLADCDVDAANLYLLFNPTHDEEEIYISGHKAVIDGNKCTNCGLCINYCRFDAISFINETVTISETSCDGCFLCSRICLENAIAMEANDKSRLYSGSFRKGKMIYGRLAPGEENSGKLVNLVRERARKISAEEGLSTIILDGPPGIGCSVISTITGVDRIIIVTEPGVSGLSDMKRAVDIVRKFNMDPHVILNKYDLNPVMTEKILEWCDKNSVAVVGKLPFREKVVNAMVSGMSIIEYDPEEEISKELIKIWSIILNSDKL